MSDILDQLFNGTLQAPTVPQMSSAPEPVADGDMLRELPVDLLEDFPADKHPFRPYTQEKLDALRRDIVGRGVIQPLIVRPLGDHRYQIISGHNRRTAAVAAGYTILPCIIRPLDDDEAVLQMISTNLQQRMDLRFSEKAFAYKMQMDTLRHQGARTDLTSSQPGTRLRADEILAQQDGSSRNQIQRYIRLTYLIPEMLDKVDEREIGFTIGETLSYLSAENQRIVDNFFFQEQHLGIDQRTADRLRELAEDGDLTGALLRDNFLSSAVKPLKRISFNMAPIQKYFAEGTPQGEIVKIIQKALKQYFDALGEEVPQDGQ